MKVTALKIPDVKLIEPDVFEDERGGPGGSEETEKIRRRRKIIKRNIRRIEMNSLASKE